MQTTKQAAAAADAAAPGLAPALPARGATDETPVAQLAWTLVEHRWTIVAFAAVVLAATGLYLALATPVYRASVLVQVDREVRPGAAFETVRTLFDAITPTEGEMEMMRSRRLLDAVIAEQMLDVEVRPRRLPVVGEAFARRHHGAEPAPARFGLAAFAWGGERLRLDTLEVSDGLLGEPLLLTALEGGRFRLASEDGGIGLEGRVGEPATQTDGDRAVRIAVAALEARPGTSFVLEKIARADAIDRLQASLQVTAEGQHTGLVKISLSGTDPARVAAILDGLSTLYVRQNVERTSEEAAKTLRILEAQLPVLKRNLEKAEAGLNGFRSRRGTVDLSLEGRALLDRAGEIDRALADVELRAGDIRRYTPQHPGLADLQERAERLRAQRAQVDAAIRALPATELEATRLSRQLRVATELYMLVLNRAEELRIVKSGWIGNVRVLEAASVPHRPVSPRPGLLLVLASVLGLLGGAVAAIARKELDPRAKHADEIEAGTRLPVFASVPRSGAQRALARRAGRRGPLEILAASRPDDPAVEDLRALASSVQFNLLRASNNVVAIGGLAPLAGKSFVSANLAWLLAATGEKVLLVDADLRRGVLHRCFGLDPEPGLAEVISGSAELSAAVRRTDQANLDVLTAGKPSASPAELLASPKLQDVLLEFGSRYRFVVVDNPPVLSVNDAALVGRHAGTNLLVVRAGQHALHDVAYAVRRLSQSGVTVRGFVLNGVPRSRAWYGGSRPYGWTGPGAA